jgi:hypothetical protein
MIFPKIRKLVPGFLNEISGENRLVSPVFLARARASARNSKLAFRLVPGVGVEPRGVVETT